MPETWNSIVRSPEGQVLAIRWEGGISRDDEDGTVSGAFVPTFFYVKSNGTPLFSSNEPKLMAAYPFAGGLARVLETDREALYGFLGTNGQWAIPPRFVEALDFAGDLTVAREPSGLWGVLGSKGQWILSPRFAQVQQPKQTGVLAARLPGTSSDFKWFDARTGALVSAYDPRTQTPPEKGGTLVDTKYKIGPGNSFGVGSLMGSSQSLIDPSGKVILPSVFTRIKFIVGSKAIVALGDFGDRMGEDQFSDAFDRSQGVYALLDLTTNHFLIPPVASQIVWRGGGLWYVSTHTGYAFNYDETRGSKQRMPNMDVLWFSGPVAVGYNISEISPDQPPNEKVDLNVYGQINDDNVRMRSQPNLKGEVLTVLSKGTPLHVREYKPEIETIGQWTGLWTRIETEEGKTGWVFSYFINLLNYYQ